MDRLNAVPRFLSAAIEADKAVSESAGMLFACWAIVIVLVAVSIIFMRAKKREYAVAVLPLAIVPFVHIFSAWLANRLNGIIALHAVEIQIVLDVTAALIACVLTGYFARKITHTRTRMGFTLSCAGFTIILALALVINIFVGARGL